MDNREIERLVERYHWLDLKESEEALANGEESPIDIAGDTPGEKLSYIAAAIWVVEAMRSTGCDFKQAIEAYRKKVR